MDRYLYAILEAYGHCCVVVDDATEKVEGLPTLLRQGWRPVRETPLIQGAGGSYVLILLERETQ